MAMTGLDIFKLLPNKNCGECGVPTCLAFAMKLVAKSVEPAACPYISEKALEILGASQSPPIRKLTLRAGGIRYEIGGETVKHRHEKTFVNRPLVALRVSDALDGRAFDAALDAIRSYRFERVGETLAPECIALAFDSGDVSRFTGSLAKVLATDMVVVIAGATSPVVRAAVETGEDPSRFIVDSITAETIASYRDIPRIGEMNLVIEAPDLESLFDAVVSAEALGFGNLLLSIRDTAIDAQLATNTTLRRLAIDRGFKPAGYPIFTDCGDDFFAAVAGVCKYSSVLVLGKYDGASLFPLLTLRQNIYTDPQKPLQITPGIHDVKEPDADAPLLVTTNFSLTYFVVSGELENSPYAARLLVTDSEGMSVLTAWSANKFTPQLIAKSLAASAVDSRLRHKKLIIPGFVAVLKGELEDALPGWEILVGPQEASDIPAYLAEVWK
jgi:acetyl-CoA decarbonylase/synthase complex subunit gamma